MQTDIASIFDFIVPFLVSLLHDNLHITVDDFTYVSTLPLAVFDLTDLPISPNRDIIVTNRQTMRSNFNQ